MHECNVTLDRPPVEAETVGRDALMAEKPGIVSDVHVQAIFRNEIGEAIPPYRIPGACNPVRAGQLIAEELDAGVLLPGNVGLRADSDDCTLVDTLESVAVLGLSDAAAAPAVAGAR